MKRFFLIALPTILVLSCNKSKNTGTSYYIDAGIDGATRNFSGNVYATRTSDNKSNGVNINGLLTTSSGEGIDLLIISHSAANTIDTGAYADSSSVYDVLLAYAPSLTATGYSAGTAVSDSAANHGISINHHLQIIVSSITSIEVKGTFSGDIFLSGDPSGDKKAVTNGTFYAKFQ